MILRVPVRFRTAHLALELPTNPHENGDDPKSTAPSAMQEIAYGSVVRLC